MEYRIVEQPESEPVTLAEARRHARVFVEDADEDAYLGALIVAARELVEAATCRSLVTRTLEVRLDAFPSECTPRTYGGRFPAFHAGGRPAIRLLYPPLQSVASIVYGPDSATLDGGAYEVVPGTPGLVLPTTSWPSEGPVEVTFTAGYGAAEDVPQVAKLAQLMLICQWYENRQPVSSSTVAQLPYAVEALLGALKWGAYP